MDSVEVRSLIRFLYSKGRTPKATFDEMKETYGGNAQTFGVVWRSPYVGALSPDVSFISSKVSFGVRPFKYRNQIRDLTSTESIFAPDYTSAPAKEL